MNKNYITINSKVLDDSDASSPVNNLTNQAQRSSEALPNRKNKTIGIIGGGQLAWMMQDALQKLDLELIVQTPNEYDPAVRIAADREIGAISETRATQRLAQKCDVITFENEFVDLDSLKVLERKGVTFRPRLMSLEPLLDKYTQRCFFRDRNLPTPDFVSPAPSIAPHLPAVLKTRRMGYDGQGTFIVKTAAEYAEKLALIGADRLLMEAFVPFDRELAVMAARSSQGEIVIYPIVETQQQNQVCRWVIAPAQVSPQVQAEIERIAQAILTDLDVIGIFGIELFLTTCDQIFVNEVAPRTHNSGHYTLDASVTSQFEQQLRAICDLPLGSPKLNCTGAVMVNLLGFEEATSDYLAQREQLAAIPNAYVHWYGKAESRPGRKLGHVTVRFLEADSSSIKTWALQQVQAIERIWQNP